MNDAYLLTDREHAVEPPVRAHRGRDLDHEFDLERSISVIVRGDRCPIVQIQPIDVRRMRDDRNARAAEEARRS